MENRLTQEMMENPFAEEPKASSAWHWQIFTGIALVLLLGLHFIANHFIAAGGIRDFADVVSYLRNPIALVLEVLFLVSVATHAMLGMRAIVIDFGISSPAEERLSQVLTVIGVLTVGYGLWLTWVIIH
jgi:succinate dehydrogenase hydrophobic anchor subunit